MDGPVTAPQVIAEEASASVAPPCASPGPEQAQFRLVDQSHFRARSKTRRHAGGGWRLLSPRPSRPSVSSASAYQISTGVGVWGLNSPVGWAWDITNFVFWIGIGHAGTLISAILFLLRQKWRTSINRSAEAMTLFAVICAAIFPGIHVGRVWMAWFLAPVPTQYGIWPNFRSPLLWDVFAVSTYFSVSVLFWYTGLVPDLGTLRDRATSKIRKFLYGIFALGWRGSNRNWRHYEMAYLLLAGLSTPLVLSVHSVVSFDFATSVIPILAHDDFSALLCRRRDLRRLRHGVDPDDSRRAPSSSCRTSSRRSTSTRWRRSFCSPARSLPTPTSMEFFISWYSGNQYEKFAFYNRIFGPYWWYWWVGMLFCNTLSPQLFWFKWCRHNIFVVYFVCMCVNAGMWFERFHHHRRRVASRLPALLLGPFHPDLGRYLDLCRDVRNFHFRFSCFSFVSAR